MPDRIEAKAALDKVIEKARVHFYKPIQIAEVLYRDRVFGDIELSKLEDYRVKSRKWRDEVCEPLLHSVSTSSARYQDDVFNENAVPPELLYELGRENRRTGGAVEAYIYDRFISKHTQMASALDYCLETGKADFSVKKFIDSFRESPGLRRSIDKIYEIVVYALFSTLAEAMELRVELSVGAAGLDMIAEFPDFTKKVMCLDFSSPRFSGEGRVYRVGVTNAADRGLDMYSNWGPAIQIKHLTLDEELARSIVDSVSSDKVIIVVRDAERGVILSLLTQIGWKSHIQSVITESELVEWYEKALHGKYSDILGNKLLYCLCEEITEEFPSVDSIPDILKKRHYEKIKPDEFWLDSSEKR